MLRVLPCKFNTTNEWLSLYAIVKIGGKEVMVKISFLSKQKSLKGKNNNKTSFFQPKHTRSQKLSHFSKRK